MTEVEINLTMEKVGGDRTLAAQALGVARTELVRVISNSPTLKARWRSRRPGYKSPDPIAVTPAESLNRIGVMAPQEMSEEERKIAESMNKEDEMLKEGLERLNFTPAEQSLAFEFAAFNNRYFLKSADICMAGLTVLGMKLQTEMVHRQERLAEVRSQMRQHFTPAPPQPLVEPPAPVDPSSPPASPLPHPPTEPPLPFTREQLADEEKNLMTAHDTLLASADRIANTHLRGMMLQAMVKYRLRNPNAAQKPGFQEKRLNGNGKTEH